MHGFRSFGQQSHTCCIYQEEMRATAVQTVHINVGNYGGVYDSTHNKLTSPERDHNLFGPVQDSKLNRTLW